MHFIIDFLKKPPFSTILILSVGFALGLAYGWVLSPPDFVDATPANLRADLQEDYLRMTIDSFRLSQDPNLAAQRWKNLGPGAVSAYTKVQQDPKEAEPAVITAYGQLIQSVFTGNGETKPSETPATSGSPLLKMVAIGGGILAVVVIIFVVIINGRRVFSQRRVGGEPIPVTQAAQTSRPTERTNFEQLGLAAPITQTMTTYVLGDDLYDESFSIDTQAGEFLGEYGVGVSEAIGVGEPKKVTALEIWLFDKNDIKTATKVLMSEHAYNDPGVRSRLEPKGEIILVEPQGQILLETATLQLLATVVDLEYGHGPLPQNSYFERVTLELAIWPKNQ